MFLGPCAGQDTSQPVIPFMTGVLKHRAGIFLRVKAGGPGLRKRAGISDGELLMNALIVHQG